MCVCLFLVYIVSVYFKLIAVSTGVQKSALAPAVFYIIVLIL